jgi:hypothetical protein
MTHLLDLQPGGSIRFGELTVPIPSISYNFEKGPQAEQSGIFSAEILLIYSAQVPFIIARLYGIPSDRSLERIDAEIGGIRMSTFSDANGDREGENRPPEWKSWNCDETNVSAE